MAAFCEDRCFCVAYSSDGRVVAGAHHGRRSPLPIQSCRTSARHLALGKQRSLKLDHDTLSTPTPATTNPPLDRSPPLLNSDMGHILNDRCDDGAAALPLHPERREIAQMVTVEAARTTSPWR